MKLLVHISDFHFGRHDPQIVAPLVRIVNRLKPQVIVVSGDLTHRGLKQQYQQAKKFLNRLPFPKVIVPGNHDLPFYNVPVRFLNPLHHYSTYIDANPEPIYIDDELAIVGINTTRRLAITGGGRITRRQLERLRDVLSKIPDGRIKVIVSHHPFDQPVGHAPRLVFGARRAMQLLTELGADIFLGGHLHISHINHNTARYQRLAGRSALIIQVGSISSQHMVREPYCFNALRIGPEKLTIEKFQWSPESGEFELQHPEQFVRAKTGWLPKV